MEAHSNTNVTGVSRLVCLPQPQSAAVEPDSNLHGPPLLSLLVPNVSTCDVLYAGLKLGPGTYHVTAKLEDAYHLHLLCIREHIDAC